MANKISVLIDVVTDKAVSGLKGFKASINDADGAVGKMKAGATGAFGAVQQHAAGMALAAGGALVAFGAKGVAAFTDLALEAGKFRDVSGATLDEASRWIAVGDDIGVGGDTISSAWNKMNIAIGSGKPLLAEYGIELKKTADGQDDANATFLNAIDVINGIQDPTKKAEVAAATFGKGWTGMSELIEQGSGTITAAMAEVSEAQIIDDSEIAKAKAYRASMDKLKDSISDLAMNLGEELTPAVTVAADTLATIAPAVGQVAGFVGDAFVEMADAAYDFGQGIADVVDALPFVDLAESVGPTLYEWQKLERATADLVTQFSEGAPTMAEFKAKMEAAGHSVEEVALATIEYRKQLDGANAVTGEAAEVTDDLTEAVDRTADGQAEADAMIEQVNATYAAQVEAVDAAAEALENLTQDMIDAVGSAFTLEQATLDLNSSYAAYQESVMATTAILNDSTVSDREKEQALRDLRSQEIGVAGDVLATAEAYALEQGAVEGTTASAQLQKEELQRQMLLMPELRGEIQLYIDKLNAVPGVIRTRFEITATGATVTPHGDFIGLPGGARASGGPVSAGRSYLVGERGMELFTPAMNGHITPHNQIAGSWGGAGGGSSSAGGGFPDHLTLIVEGQPLTAVVVQHGRRMAETLRAGRR